jgi:hypothetical protein
VQIITSRVYDLALRSVCRPDAAVECASHAASWYHATT